MITPYDADYSYTGDGFQIHYNVEHESGPPSSFNYPVIEAVDVLDIDNFKDAYGDIEAATFLADPQKWGEDKFSEDQAWILLDEAGLAF